MKKINQKLLYVFYGLILVMFIGLKLSGKFEDMKTVEVQQGWLPIVALGASVLGSVIQGAQQRKQARELERQNTRPNYQTNTNLLRNQAIAQQMSRVGLPDQVYNNQLNQIQQGFTTGLRQINQRGNVAVNTNALMRNANQAIGNLNAQDAQAQMQWTQQLMGSNSALANDDRYRFNVNELQPYQQNMANIASMRRAGTQNIFGGLGMLGQGAMMGVFNNVIGGSDT